MESEHFPHDQDKLYKRIYIGVGWPGQRPGYCCVIGELHLPTTHRFVLLDEFEAFDTKTLIDRIGGFDGYFMPEKILTGERDKSVTKLLFDYNQSLTPGKPGRRLRIIPSRIRGLEKDLFKYCLPKLKSMIGPEGDLDISKGKLLMNYLSIIQDSDVAAIKAGDYPAVESAIYAISDLDIDVKTGTSNQSNKAIHKTVEIF